MFMNLRTFSNPCRTLRLHCAVRFLSSMVKRKRSPETKTRLQKGEKPIPPVHDFTVDEVARVRSSLLEWYDVNKRDLPWRKQAENPDANQRAYAGNVYRASGDIITGVIIKTHQVWVSEIMLQQTQVATVIDYYNKWMKKWPTLQDLASSSLEEVNEMWSGLGYYSRGRRLHEGAKKIVEELDGKMPSDAGSLLKDLPGVGKYTAGAIASIAYNQVTGLVDGNVIRVLARLRMIGADSTSQSVTDALWQHANTLVDPKRPGDFNQSVMELGATVCTPKNPDCAACPVRKYCKASIQVEQQKQVSAKKLGQTGECQDLNNCIDIECAADGCCLCLPETDTYDLSLGVMNYPRKGKKKAARQETTAVYVLCKKCLGQEDQYFITQRPKTGLLAGLWEFPSLLLDSEDSTAKSTTMLDKYGIKVLNHENTLHVGEVVHIFSHIHQTYVIEALTVEEGDLEQESGIKGERRWVTKQEFLEAAVSTAMKKVFKAFENAKSKGTKACTPSRKTKGKPALDDGKQKSIDSFFKPKLN